MQALSRRCRGLPWQGCKERAALNSAYQLSPSCRRMASCQFFPVAPIVVLYKASMGFSIRRGLAAHGCEAEMVGCSNAGRFTKTGQGQGGAGWQQVTVGGQFVQFSEAPLVLLCKAHVVQKPSPIMDH